MMRYYDKNTKINFGTYTGYELGIINIITCILELAIIRKNENYVWNNKL